MQTQRLLVLRIVPIVNTRIVSCSLQVERLSCVPGFRKCPRTSRRKSMAAAEPDRPTMSQRQLSIQLSMFKLGHIAS